MTDPWEKFFDLLDAGWPGDLTPDAAEAYRTLLDGIPPEHIVNGLRRLLHKGARFRPSAAELLGEARRDPSVPTVDEAFVLLFGRSGVMRAQPRRRTTDEGGVWREGEREAAVREARTERANTMHPLIGAFIARFGFDRLASVDLTNEWDRKELREAWDAHLEAMEGREVAVLAAGTGQKGLRQMDPLAALNAPAHLRALEPGEAA